MSDRKVAVFIMLGQSNAVGHGIPMDENDRIVKPLTNVFGLSRINNQALYSTSLKWSGYTSYGMNLAEEQDHTYSIPNCLALLWQKSIDGGIDLPDLYIVQIAIGAQGVTDGYMWHPERKEKLIPGKLGEVDISLYPFTEHIFSLIGKSFSELGIDYEIIGVHWRGGENDVTADKGYLMQDLKKIYDKIFDMTDRLLDRPPIILHKIVCADRMNALDASGKMLDNMHYINEVFKELEKCRDNVTVFDPAEAPQYLSDVFGNGLFIDDAVHFTPEVNKWISSEILEKYCKNQ